MGKIDTKKIESAAVGAVREAFHVAHQIYADIRENDRTLCVDGELQVYDSNCMSKDHLIGIIQVQVKGTTSKRKSATPKRSISVSDLHKYLEVYDGVLYFTVFMSPDLNVRSVYYAQLLPYDLHDILTKQISPGQKTVSIMLRELPHDSFLLHKLCKEFLANQRLQKRAEYVAYSKLEDLENEGISFKEMQFGTLVSDRAMMGSLKTWCNGTYKYGVTSEGKMYVFDKMQAPIEVAAGADRELHADGITETMMVYMGEGQQSRFIEFGSFRIDFDETDATIEYTPTGTFHERLRDAKLMRAICRSGKLSIDGIELCRDIAGRTDSISMLDEQVQNYGRIVRTLDSLRMKIDWDPAILSNHEMHQLEQLADAQMDNKRVFLPNQSGELINLNMDIQESRIKMIAHRQEDGGYALYDPLSDKLLYAIGVDSNPEPVNPLPAFFIMNKDDFKLAGNIDIHVLENCLNSLPINQYTSDFVCTKLLQMLLAYDEGAVCSADLYYCMQLLAELLLKLDPTDDSSVINFAQVLKRREELPDDLKKQLRAIASTSENAKARACAYLLLDMQDFANDIMNSMTREEKEILSEWPIMRFWKSDRRGPQAQLRPND